MARPFELCARLFGASVIVLGVLYVLQRPLAQELAPAFRGVISWLASEFSIGSVRIGREGPNETLQFQANLSRPVNLGDRTVYPFGWRGIVPAGYYEVAINVGAVFQYCALALTLVLAWPAARIRELMVRIALAVPMSAVLLFIDVPSTVVAELWGAVRNEYGPPEMCGWMVWSRFLMDGGGWALGCLVGALTILAAQPHVAVVRITRPSSVSPRNA